MTRHLTLSTFQAVCEWGRDSLESWGRKKRSLPHNETEAHSQEEDMNISQEILVLDFGDERQSTDFLRSDKPGGVASEANFGGNFRHTFECFALSILSFVR